jgi:hypothetical protein
MPERGAGIPPTVIVPPSTSCVPIPNLTPSCPMLRVDRASRAEKRAPVVIEWLPIAHYPRLLLGHFIQEKLPLFPGIRDPSFVRILAHGLERIERPNGGQSELIL